MYKLFNSKHLAKGKGRNGCAKGLKGRNPTRYDMSWLIQIKESFLLRNT